MKQIQPAILPLITLVTLIALTGLTVFGCDGGQFVPSPSQSRLDVVDEESAQSEGGAQSVGRETLRGTLPNRMSTLPNRSGLTLPGRNGTLPNRSSMTLPGRSGGTLPRRTIRRNGTTFPKRVPNRSGTTLPR